MCSVIVLKSSVLIYNLESNKNKEKPEWESVSKLLTGSVYTYFLFSPMIAVVGKVVHIVLMYPGQNLGNVTWDFLLLPLSLNRKLQPGGAPSPPTVVLQRVLSLCWCEKKLRKINMKWVTKNIELI